MLAGITTCINYERHYAGQIRNRRRGYRSRGSFTRRGNSSINMPPLEPPAASFNYRPRCAPAYQDHKDMPDENTENFKRYCLLPPRYQLVICICHDVPHITDKASGHEPTPANRAGVSVAIGNTVELSSDRVIG